MSVSQDTVLALVGTLFGGAGLEFVRRALSKSKEKEDSATALRNELRTELTSLKTDMQSIERELDVWKQKYYELYEKYVEVKIRYDSALKQLAIEGKIPEEMNFPSTPLDRTLIPPVVSEQAHTDPTQE